MRVALVFFCLLVFALLNFSVEMCADSLASGCLFSKHFYVRNRKLSFFFGAPNCDLGGLVPQFLHPWELFCHLGGTWATLGAAGRTCGDPGSHFCRFWHDLGPHSESFSGTDG